MFAKTYSDSKSCPYRNRTEKNIPLWCADVSHIERTAQLVLLKHIVIAKAAVIETVLENIALWYPDVSHIEKV